MHVYGNPALSAQPDKLTLAGACLSLHIRCIRACFELLCRRGSLLIYIFVLEHLCFFQLAIGERDAAGIYRTT